MAFKGPFWLNQSYDSVILLYDTAPVAAGTWYRNPRSCSQTLVTGVLDVQLFI